MSVAKVPYCGGFTWWQQIVDIIAIYFDVCIGAIIIHGNEEFDRAMLRVTDHEINMQSTISKSWKILCSSGSIGTTIKYSLMDSFRNLQSIITD